MRDRKGVDLVEGMERRTSRDRDREGGNKDILCLKRDFLIKGDKESEENKYIFPCNMLLLNFF